VTVYATVLIACGSYLFGAWLLFFDAKYHACRASAAERERDEVRRQRDANAAEIGRLLHERDDLRHLVDQFTAEAEYDFSFAEPWASIEVEMSAAGLFKEQVHS
jgi:hypothetical protein